ncbi:MAG: carboxypeptidase-like regulatory domain-containing protein [Candidatus Manganitrophus sp. SA1]|nr:carboxypeptidase-like regulatory domain-containing protein [Candidatus Manganitrophus morganii]
MSRCFFLTLLILTLPLPALAADFNGRVVEERSREGISDLTVRLIPPKAAGRPEKATTTDERGGFRFPDIERGRYLLEVYQGTTLLYREVVETDQETIKEIQLSRKGR